MVHVVQPGETIQSIAENYGISADKIIQDNGLIDPEHLAIGQSIVISVPQIVHIIKEGDTLEAISNSYQVPLLQLLANNPYLSDREYLYPGDTIIISYDRKGTITTHGNTIPTINMSTLRKSLPYLTYLSILNYTATSEGEIVSYYDDTEVIATTKNYGVAPLMLLTTLTIKGEANLRVDFDLLLNEEFQNRQIDNIMNIIKMKGYYGLNLSLQYISESNFNYYIRYVNLVAARLKKEGYPLFITVNPKPPEASIEINFPRVDYSPLNLLVNNMIFMTYEWALNVNPPSPISSVQRTEAFLEYILNYVPPEKVIIGIATLGYDWVLPYVPGISDVNLLFFDNVSTLAFNHGEKVSFDDSSQTPYFTYTVNGLVNHVVWFIDARTINATLDLVSKYNLSGVSVWNITKYNSQLWLMINSQYEIEKVSL